MTPEQRAAMIAKLSSQLDTTKQDETKVETNQTMTDQEKQNQLAQLAEK